MGSPVRKGSDSQGFRRASPAAFNECFSGVPGPLFSGRRDSSCAPWRLPGARAFPVLEELDLAEALLGLRERIVGAEASAGRLGKHHELATHPLDHGSPPGRNFGKRDASHGHPPWGSYSLAASRRSVSRPGQRCLAGAPAPRPETDRRARRLTEDGYGSLAYLLLRGDCMSPSLAESVACCADHEHEVGCRTRGIRDVHGRRLFRLLVRVSGRAIAMALAATVFLLLTVVPSFAGHSHSGIFIGVGPFWWGPPYPYWTYYHPAYHVYVPPAVIVEEPRLYIQQAPPPPPSGPYWYYCPSARAYYPTVRECPEPWVKVPPRPE
jgi:hypothetical protein